MANITLLNKKQFDQTWSNGIPWKLSMLSGFVDKHEWAKAAQNGDKVYVARIPDFFFGPLPEGAEENTRDGNLRWDPTLVSFDTALELYKKAHLKAIKAVEGCVKLLKAAGYDLSAEQIKELAYKASSHYWLTLPINNNGGVLKMIDYLLEEISHGVEPVREAKIIASLKNIREANNSLLLAYLVYAIYKKVNDTFTVSDLPEAFFTKGGGLIVKVPKEDMGRYIGRGGSNIKEVSAALKEAGIKFFKVVEK